MFANHHDATVTHSDPSALASGMYLAAVAHRTTLSALPNAPIQPVRHWRLARIVAATVTRTRRGWRPTNRRPTGQTPLAVVAHGRIGACPE